MYYGDKFVRTNQLIDCDWDYNRLIKNAEKALSNCKDKDMQTFWNVCLSSLHRKANRLH